MRIIWLQDMDPMSTGGGAQLTDRAHIVEGLKRGHDIRILTPQNQNTLLLHKSDFLIFSNVASFTPERLLKLPNRYAVFHHDWWFRCKWRLFLPLSEKCLVDCPQGPVYRPILEKAALHIFLSPLHYQINKEYFADAVEPHLLVPSPVNPDIFFDQKKPDRKNTCNLNGLLPFKGKANLLKYAKEHPDVKIRLAGDREKEEELPSNCEFIGPIPDTQLPSFYNTHEYYIELPDTPQPFNRTIAESYLCGCKIKGNKLIGALSWPWFNEGRQTVAERLNQSPKDFWNGLESILI